MNKGRKQNNLYGNIMLVGHEGDCLGRISEKRANFYLKKDLAYDYTSEMILSKDDTTKFIKLKFPENGLGKNGQKFFMAKRENQCVVCGEKESLHKTYIVPKEFRDHMPESYKLHNDYDLMLMCTKHHNIFSQLLQKQKNDFIKKSGFKDEIECLPKQLKEVKKAAKVCLDLNIPAHVRKEKFKFIDSVMSAGDLYKAVMDGHYITVSHFLSAISKLPDFYKSKSYKPLPQKIIEHINWSTKKLNEFIISWRMFFTMSMIPKFLPEHWAPYNNLIVSNCKF